MRKLAAAFSWMLGIGLLIATFAAPASAQYPPQEATCGVGDTTLSAGDQLTISGEGWEAGSTIAFTLQPEDVALGSTTANSNGNFSTVLTIPASIQAGPHSIECSGTDVQGQDVVLANDIQILGAGAGTAFTGSSVDVPLWTALAAGLLILGTVLFVAGRRRTSRSAGTRS